MSHLKSKYIKEEKISINDIPAILLTPKEVDGLNHTIIFYNGWSSNKESQRIRGLILATVGYQVLIPDAIHHGERNPLKNYGVENTIEYFWDIILNNLEEGDILVEELISKYKAHPERIGVVGH